MDPRLTLHPADGGVRCPCCGTSAGARLLEVVPFREIWDGLRVTWGARFSEEVIRRHTPNGEVSLLECPSCGVQFFDPSVAGDAGFYRELGTSPRYYSPWKWEFDWFVLVNQGAGL